MKKIKEEAKRRETLRMDMTTEIKRIASCLHLPDSTEIAIIEMFTRGQEKRLHRGIHGGYDALIAGVVFAAAKLHNIPRTPGEVSEATGMYPIDIVRASRLVSRELGLRILPTRPVQYLPRFVSKFSFSIETQGAAEKILERVETKNLCPGKKPSAVCGAALYIAGKEHGEFRSQMVIAEKIGCTDVAIRMNVNRILRDDQT